MQKGNQKFIKILLTIWEAPWSGRECQGLKIRAMVLGCGFKSWLYLTTRWKDGPLDDIKITKIIMTAKSHQKNILKRESKSEFVMSFERQMKTLPCRVKKPLTLFLTSRA